jgi:predicted ATPase/DNA-binding SARP family transcriptional activator
MHVVDSTTVPKTARLHVGGRQEVGPWRSSRIGASVGGERLEVSLLGPVEARLDGVRVTPSSAAQRVVLAALALSAGRVVGAGQLIDALWPGEPPTNPIGNLQTYVSRLRRVVGVERLTHSSAGYRLHLEPDQVDIAYVESLVAEARAHRGRDPIRAAELMGEALAVWRGDPLSDLTDPLAFAPAIARLSAWKEQLQQEWFQLRLDAGQAAQALPSLKEAVLADPMSEELHLLLMRALHQLGRTAEALRIAAGFRRRLVDETGLDPSPAFAELQEQVLADDPDLRSAPPPSTQPPVSTRRRAPGDRFVGRQAEMERVTEALRGRRLVSVIGPGGVGKTRLVLELFDRLDAGDERFIVEFGEVSAAADVEVSVAAALGLQAAPDGVTTAIATRLGAEPALLVLDNCEHVLRPVRDLMTELLARCPGLQLLATSRQRLGLADEQVVRLGPLSSDEQIELFFDRASRLRDDLDTSEPSRLMVAEICRVLDGLPLAVELAARREAVFGLAQLRDRLAAGLEVLDPARGGDRSTAVTATVEWSYRLIDPDAQTLFDRLAVCHGGFPLAALDHLAPPGLDNPSALLAELVEASLVVADPTGDPPRFRLLELMRHVGLGHLSADELDRAHEAHAGWALAIARTIDDRQSHRAADVVPLLRQELGSIREALSWLMATSRWDRAAQLAMLVAVPVADDPDLALLAQLERFEAANDQIVEDSDADTVARCRIAAGAATWFGGDANRADRLLTVALRSLGADHPERWVAQLFFLWNRMYLGDPLSVEGEVTQLLVDPCAPTWARANGVCCTAMMHLFAGDRATAEGWMADHRELLAEVADRDGLVACTYGELAADHDPHRALAWFDQAYRQCEAHGHTYNREVAAIGRTAVLIRLGHHEEAVDACHRLIDTVWQMGMWPQTWTALRLAAELLVALDDLEPAAVLLAAGEVDRRAPVVIGTSVDHQVALWSRIEVGMDGSRLSAARARGAVGARSDTVRLALAALERHR